MERAAFMQTSTALQGIMAELVEINGLAGPIVLKGA